MQPSLAAALWNFDATQTAALLDAELKAPEVLAIAVYQQDLDKAFLFQERRKPGVGAETGTAKSTRGLARAQRRAETQAGE